MAFPLSVFLAQVNNLLESSGGNIPELSELNRYRQIKQAVERYSIDRPFEYTEDLSGDGGKYYAITSLTKFVDWFSRVIQIEYPAQAVSADHTPQYLDPEDWDDEYRTTGNTRYLFFPTHAPATGETARVKYTAPYLWTNSTVTKTPTQTAHGFAVNEYVYQENGGWIESPDSRPATHIVTAVADANNFTAALLQADIPTGDFFAVCNLAAGLCCQAAADKYSRTSDSTINADSIGTHITRAGEFARRAKELIALYERHLGIGADAPRLQAAGQFVDLDTAPGWPGSRDYLFHGRKVR